MISSKSQYISNSKYLSTIVCLIWVGNVDTVIDRVRNTITINITRGQRVASVSITVLIAVELVSVLYKNTVVTRISYPVPVLKI